MTEIRLGLIGCKRGCSIIRSTRTVPNHRLTALCDRYEDRMDRAHELLDDAEVKHVTDHRRMLEDKDIDAVILAVAPEDNVDLVCEALDAGKHVLCEVPLAYTIEDCWRVVLAVERSGLKFQMAEQVRYAPYIQAWKKMVQEGKLGKILFAEGQYLHGMQETRYWQDARTGRALTPEQARENPNAMKTRLWNMPHPILYLPHELSPILSVLDDRVESVTCMGTRRQSYVHEWFPVPDIEVALMHTVKDTILRVAVGFTAKTIKKDSTCQYHWYHFFGTKGTVETNRANCDKMKLWLADAHMKEPAELMWEYVPGEVPGAVLSSGHGGGDYYPLSTFVDSILNDTEPPMNAYTAADSAAPAIVAVQSVEQDSRRLPVPDFRPGPHRKPGERGTA